MEQPPGFEVPGMEDWVMHLMKSIYGMKQASQVWNQTFDKAVKEMGFEQLQCKWCVYHRTSPTGTIIFTIHVDDILSTASSPEENALFSALLKTQWEITELGPPTFALGISISRNRNNRTISLSQTAKIDNLVANYRQSDAHSVDTPMVAGLQLCRPDKSLPTPPKISKWTKKTPFHRLVGRLMYIAITTWPDIA